MRPPSTERITFRSWREGDLDQLHAACSCPQVMQFVADGRTWSRQRTADFLRNAQAMEARQGYCQWALQHVADEQLIGFCGIVPEVAVESASQRPEREAVGVEIGWRLAPEYWGQGLATEAAAAVLEFALRTLHVPQVIATVQAANRASLRVVQKLGMSREREFERNGRTVVVFSAAKSGLAGG